MNRLKNNLAGAAVMLLAMQADHALAEAVSAECRGVAAGVVATMRAAGELPSQDMAGVAITAARRACAAARDNLAAQPVDSVVTTAATETPAADDAATTDEASAEEPTIWELLSRDRDLKPGNKRLRRLKQQ